MEHRNIFYAKNRAQWRSWLSENFEKEDEVWFVFPSKEAGEEGVSYNDSVEEALCFGWIDSTAGKLDEKHGLRRFTPRKDSTYYSRPNIERLCWLEKQGMIHPKIRGGVLKFINEPYVFPSDIIEEIKKDEIAWENYKHFSEPYKRIRIDYINASRKRPDEFKKRLSSFIGKTRQNKLIIGFGGIEKYYK